MNTPDSSAVNLQHVYTVSDRLIALQIQEGTLTKGEQIPYTALPGDQIWNDGDVFREGEFYGRFVDEAQSLIRIADQYVGQPFDLTSTTNPANYTLTSDTTPLTITEIFHKSKLTQLGQVGAWDFASPTTHTVYLELAEPLTQGETYTLDLATPELGTVAFTYQPEATRSEAVHVSHLGFDPDDPAKVAFLSTWMADDAPVEYEVGTPFWLIDTATGAKVYEGQIELAKAKEEAEDRRGRNYNGTDVYWMDFSDFSEAGEYQVLVDDIGTSYTFEIGEKTWEDAFYTSVRGLYHQRSGIALEQPYTDYERPRPFHPDDGVVVYQSTATLMDTSEGLNLNGQSSFDALTAGITDEVLSEAWGGWFDAGDWDRRIQHVSVSRDLLELAASNLDYFAQLDLNLPESDNTLPDVIDEALWGLDFFRRLQTSEGGIRGGVESAGHPRGFEASWQESQTVMAYAPDMWSSYLYAGVAAQAAHVLQNIDPVLSQTYAESSIRAMGWAEAEYAAYSGDSVVAIDNARNLAAAELYRLTGEEQWHELFLDTTIFKAPGVQIYQDATTRGHETAAWVYSQTAHTGVNVQVQANARAALLQEADTQISWLENTGFKWNKHAWAPLGYGSLGAPDADTLIRAHQLTGEEQYLEAAILATQFAAGANPDNMVYTTGLGHRSPQDPLVVDARATGNEPPPGITVYGPLDLQAYGWQWGLGLFDETLSPDPFRWPTTEAYFDAYFYIPATEFTVQQTIAPTAYTWGYLAAVDEIAEIPSDTENPIDSTPTPPAIPPIAQNDAFTTDEDTVVRGNVLTNDSDPDSPSLTVTLVSGAANGDLQLTSDGSFEYNPTNNFNGTDSFIYEVSDGELTDKATVTININRTDTHLDLGSDELPVDTEPEKPLPPTGGIDLPADGVQETPTDNVQDVIGEYGSLSLNHQWQTISLDESYIDPVVIVSDPTFNGPHPATVRLRSVTQDTFQIRLQEPAYKDGWHTKESVSYLVVEAGDWTLADGTRISAGTHDSNRLTSKGFDEVDLTGFDTTPTVLSQVQTFNGSDWVITRTKDQSSTAFQLAMQEEEVRNQGSHVDESIGWLAIESGVANDGDTLLQGGTTERSYNHKQATVALEAGFDAAPSVIAKVSSFYGKDTANLRIDEITQTSFGAKVHEERSLDKETWHTNESLAFLALEGTWGSLAGLAAASSPLT